MMQSQAGLLYLTSTFAFRALSDAGAIVRRIVLFSAAVACAVAQSPGTFIATGAMTTPRAQYAASLPWMAAGFTYRRLWKLRRRLAECEDLRSGNRRFHCRADAMLANRRMHSSTPLPDGHVLIVGSFGAGNSP